jgi:NADH dehydrogenase
VEDDPEVRRELLTYVFVGAGYAGVEGFAELQDFAADALERYPRARLDGVRFILVEARERIMMEVPESLAEFASAELRRRGMEIRAKTTVERVTDRAIELSGGEVVPTRTVTWTAGV